MAGATLLLAMPIAIEAQTWNEDFINQPFNLRYASLNPTRIADNHVNNFAVGHVGYTWGRGDYHAIEQSGRANELTAYIGGLRRIGRVDLQGHLRYRNLTENDQAWSTALWNLRDNPFMLCDSIPGDATTESFDMSAKAAYPFNERLRGAIEVGISTGKRSDQNDPRPRTTTSAIPVTLGIDYAIGEAWRLGLAAGIRYFSSGVDYTNTQQSATKFYFIMKGMGDYQKRSTADYTSYTRDYTGMTYRAALSATWSPADARVANHVEAGFAAANEDARDGGTAYEYKGGDYSQTAFSVSDRLRIRANERMLHNISLCASMLNGKATWYDQKRETDLDHGNLQYYRVLGSSVVQKTQRINATLGYEFHLLRQGERDLYAGVQAGMTAITHKHFVGTIVPKQSIARIDIDAHAGKSFAIRRATLLAQVNGGYTLPVTKYYANGSTLSGTDDISGAYTRRIFEYETAPHAHVGIVADASMPAGKKLAVGLHAGADVSIYTGTQEYWRGFDGHSYTRVQIGAYLKF